ncbi:transcriptional regulator MraZ [Jannaschia pagri]|uniref:Transcriptional regulator MraZ n=1 Tax=Jannaschia pagri TaxID=2829797 RepID=A0ABQ4NJS6_9RHOB|nr:MULTISPECIES: hypothetical protein [unclassified Jannaschia]GIT90622.1 transcriptional regulator MraZ [Jannaschia sp. AI_61]GIT94454.1 transcriptional regulator MraZ [Jannaschia sp. AI_62]
MDDQFRGKHTVKVDGKGRVSIPATFRRALEANHPGRAEGEPATLYISQLETEPFLTCMTHTFMADMTQSIKKMHKGDPRREALEEFIYENVHELSLDANGRCNMPKSLRDHAGLGDEIIFGGRGDTFRIYSPDVPRAAVSKLSQQMSQLPPGTSIFALLPQDDAGEGT